MQSKNLHTALAYAAAIITALAGLTALAGWHIDNDALKTFGFGGVTMKVNTTLCFLFSGLALFFLQNESRRLNIILARVFAAATFLLGLAVLSQYIFRINLGVDEFLFRDAPDSLGTINPGRMAPNTTLNFVLLGMVLFAFSFKKLERNHAVLFLFISAFTISLIGLLGYLFGLTEFTGLAVYTKMAINTALVFVVLSTGIYFTMYNSKRTSTTLEYKLLSGLTVATVVILIGAVISLASIQSLVSASDNVEHTLHVKQELGKLNGEVYELVAAGRAYLLSGNETFLESWKLSKANIPKLIGNIEDLTKDNTKQQNELAALKQIVRELINFSESLVATYKTSGKEAAEELFSTLKGKKINDEIDKIVTRMSDEESQLVLERNARETSRAVNTFTIIVLNLGLVLLLFALLYVLVKKDISGRRKAEAALLKLNEELECRVRERTAELAQSVEQIKKANRVYAVLSNVNQAIVRVKDQQTLFGEACRIAVDDGKFRMAWIGMVDEQANKFTPVATAGLGKEFIGGLEIDLSNDKIKDIPIVRVLKSGTNYLENDIANEVNMNRISENILKSGFKSSAAFPINLSGKTVGAFMLYSDEEHFFNVAEVKLLDEMAMDISFAMESIENEAKRNRAEEKLHRANERFNRLVSSLNDVVWTATIEGSEILDVNQSFQNIYGITLEELKANPNLWIEMVHPEDRHIAEASRKELREKGKSETEYRIVKPDGTIAWLFDRKSLIYDETGKLVQMGGIAKDITEQKNAEELIITQRDLGLKINSITTLDELYTISIDALLYTTGMECGGIYLFDNEGQNLDLIYSIGLSKQFCEATSHFDGQSDHVKFVNTGKPAFIEYARLPVKFSDIVKKENLQSFILLPLLNKDKVVGCINLASRKQIAVPIRQQNGIETIAVLVANALERIRNEEEIRNMNVELEMKVEQRTAELREKEENFRNMANNISQLAWMADEQGSIFWYNQRWFDYTGTTLDEMNGWGWQKVHHPDHVKAVVKKIKHCFETGEVWEDTFPLRGNDGLYRWFLSRAVPIRDEQGNVLRWFGTNTDITENRRAEQEIKEAKLEAERANLAKSEFLSRMSHELRTPMNSILGFAQLMNMGELTPNHKIGVDHILKSGKHLLDLINEVLDLSRIEAGELSISIEPVQIRGIVAETLDVVKPLATSKNITFEFPESPVSDMFVKSDRQKLKQVLLNLLSNAVKYNREGGTVRVECSQTQATSYKPQATSSQQLEAVSLKPDTVKKSISNIQYPISNFPEPGQPATRNPQPGTIRISITDTGKGIAPEYMDRLFNPFERIGAEISEVEGTGLGLAVSKKLMEAMNGTIGVDSEPGVGSAFWIELPQAESQVERHERNGGFIKPETESAVSGTLLYIEDNVSNIHLVEQILEMHRPQIRLITEMYGKRTVQLATDFQPDMILLDLDLPDIHGSEVLKLLRKDSATKTIPVVVLSADAMNSQIDKLMKSGAKNYLVKPLNVLEFLKVVDEVMKK